MSNPNYVVHLFAKGIELFPTNPVMVYVPNNGTATMKLYALIYLPTGRRVMHKTESCTVVANTEIGAKRKFTKLFGYVNWDLHIVIEL